MLHLIPTCQLTRGPAAQILIWFASLKVKSCALNGSAWRVCTEVCTREEISPLSHPCTPFVVFRRIVPLGAEWSVVHVDCLQSLSPLLNHT